MARHLIQRTSINLLLRSQPQLQLSRVVLQVHMPERYTSFKHFASQSKLLNKNLDVSDHTCNISNYNDYYVNYKPLLYSIIETLKDILNLKNSEVTKILMVYPQLKKRSRANILNNYYNLLEAGVEKNTIVSNVWLLAHGNDKLKNKLNCISTLKMNNDQLMPWLCLTEEELTKYVFYTQDDMVSYTYNKIEHLAHRLECSIQELCELTVRYPFLLKIPVSYIDKKLDILYEYNVENKYILKDLWVLRYTENQMRQRCELYKDTRNLKIKTWAIRCPVKVIFRAIHRNCARYNVMKHHKNTSEYLMNKLSIDKQTLDRVIVKSPSILRVNLVKMNALINILHKNDITSKEILKHERIFYFNVTTIQNRITILNEINFPLRLPVLMCSEKMFEQYVNKHRLEREVLQNHHTVKDYLINKLNTDKATLEKALKRWPNILRVKVRKTDELINILQENGITTDEILNHGRIFYSKIDTVRKRIEILKEANMPIKISVFIYTQKMLDNYMKSKKLNQIT